MKIMSDDGNEFASVESCKKYEAEKKKDDSDRKKMLDAIKNLHENIENLMAKEADLVHQYCTKYPNSIEDVLDFGSVGMFDFYEGEDEDDECDDDCESCDDYDACVTQAAFDFIESFENLQNLIHRLD